MHVVRFKPDPTDPPDFYICWQCGFVIRLFETPASDRRQFVLGDDTAERLNAHFRVQGLPTPDQRFASFLLQGILTQLRTVPIGFRVDDWLLSEYPEVRSLQVRSVHAQLADNSRALSTDLRGSVAPEIISANTEMNAAFAQYWARSLADESVTLPYRAIGMGQAGERLIAAYDQNNAAPFYDTGLVDTWAALLGLAGWYRWIEHDLD